MRAIRFFCALIILALIFMGVSATAADLDPEKKAEFENLLIGDWTVPENKYETTIEFNFDEERAFTCTYTEPDKDPVTWAGQWKVRTTKSGIRVFLKGQSQEDSDKWMKAVIRSNQAMDIFAILITWDFKSGGNDTWQSVLEKAAPEAAEEGEGEEEEEEEWAEDDEMEEEEEWEMEEEE